MTAHAIRHAARRGIGRTVKPAFVFFVPMWATFNNRERKHLERKFDSMKLDEIVAYGRNGLKIGKIKNVNSGTRLAGESDERYEPSFVFL